MRRWMVVLVSPQESGNVGGAARVIKNFGAGGLRIVAPRCEVHCSESRRFSAGAAELLRTAEEYDSLEAALADRELCIGLTGIGGRLHKFDCIELIPTNLLEGKNHITRGALVFGREDKGMAGEELELCDFLWKLPTNPDFPSMNLVQAIGIALAAVADSERRLGLAEPGVGPSRPEKSLNPLAGSPKEEDQPAAHEAIQRLIEHVGQVMLRTGWHDDSRVRGNLMKIRNLIARGNATRRDVALLHGLCKQTLGAIEHPERVRGTKPEDNGV